jgi:uncharacterized membrane protein
MQRFWEIDFARGLAALLMLAYHLLFDLNYLKINEVDLSSVPLLTLRTVVGVSFVFIAGVSAHLSSEKNSGNFSPILKRFALLGSAAILVTLATMLYPGNGFVVFGILHLLAVCTLLYWFFKKNYWKNFVLGILLVAAGTAIRGVVVDSPALLWLGVVYPGFYSLDYYPLIPWFGIFLLGAFASKTIYCKGIRIFKIRDEPRVLKPVSFLGKRALVFYLLHQPVLFVVLLAYRARFLENF